ncbi:MAG: ligand-binding protein, RmlD family [Pelagibacteraceae bacterium TMED201]|nr:sugar nucleotide-binding protein [Pelagibacterales bacterium SAG-MED30]OUW63561.1 MAG: ligand-binding protein, RmlD family [Pelagibacteraceae bacterium TMED201]|tara:strand:- start:599 stop:1309 length:711 start_codon:yes stop_codon:yes gene_type:complete
MKKILFTGGSGRFAKVFKLVKNKYQIEYPSKKKFNIESFNSVLRYLKKSKPDYLIHCAALSRPMKIHEKNISKSILINIIGTSNIVRACSQKKIKLIYFSTNYVYPGIKGNYSEHDPVLPINNYAISKLGGECAVQMYKNSLILRISMTEKPFIHKEAFNDVEMNFMYHEDLAKNLLKLINHKGIINVGGSKNTVYNFAKKDNRNVKPVASKKIIGKQFPRKQTMNLKKYHKIIKK